jgi:cyclopropane fatty-acyl-phospholipid synthase-like methyltransferase
MRSTDRQYFRDMYRESDDPWNFATSEYEERKYAMTLSALPLRRYANAFEPGCSIGVLSELLAERCDRVLSTDIVDVALEQATSRVAHLGNVRIERRPIPEKWPRESFDLIVMSELAYYFDLPTLDEILGLVVDTTATGAHLVGVHWRGVTNYPLSAHGVHRRINRCTKLRRVVHLLDENFLLDVWERV